MSKNETAVVLEDAFYLGNSDRQDGFVKIHPAISSIEVVSEDEYISLRLTQEELERMVTLLKDARSQFDILA